MDHMKHMAIIFLAAASCGANAAPPAFEDGAPRLTLTASPRVGLPPLRVTLRAALTGLEAERWYCRPVEWTWPDGTRSTYVADCVPWATHTPADYPREWVKRMSLGAPGTYVFEVALLGGDGKTLAREQTTVNVAGVE